MVGNMIDMKKPVATSAAVRPESRPGEKHGHRRQRERYKGEGREQPRRRDRNRMRPAVPAKRPHMKSTSATW